MSVERAKSVPPFVLWCTAMIPTAFDDSMSYYEALCALYKFIQDNLVEPINNNATVLDQTVKDMAALKEYVDTYFDNLDVQEEINNKLDAMAEGGQLAEIIAQYANLPCIHAYDTIAAMAASENLIDGSVARAMSKTVAGTGDGNYYKVREIQEGDTPDGVNLVAITGTTLVAEIIPDASIEEISQLLTSTKASLEAEIDDKFNKTDNITLQNYLMYDMPTSLYSQGSNMDSNGNVYVYAGENATGRIFVFDGTSESLTNTISVDLGHGGSIVKKGNYIYAAPAITGRSLYKYNVSNGTRTTDTTFADETQYDSVIAVSDYSDDKILVVLGNTNTYQNATSLCPCVYDLTNGTYTKITLTNSKNYKINQLYALQCVAYYDKHIYVLASEPDCILDFYVEENSADLQKIYQLPRRDLFGLTLGEVEAISHVPNTDTFLLTAHVKENQHANARTLKMYFFSFDTELPQVYKTRIKTENQSYWDLCYLDNSSTSLYEDGSETYPFKTLTRALESVNHSKLYTGAQIIVKSGTYNVGRICFVKGVLNAYDENTTIVFDTANSNTQFSNSDILIKPRGGSITFNNMLEIDGSSFKTFGGSITFEGTIEASETGDVSIEQALLDYSGKAAEVVIRSGATLRIGVNTNSTIGTSGKLYRISSNAVLTTSMDAPTSTFDLDNIGDAWTIILAGKHSADV
ncbi:MAG: hypothetical protein IK117_08400 [Bacteroidales bacterium]|nr:hypothetical protein [Bacteroidales bacterium]